jgi:hypothetical protein
MLHFRGAAEVVMVVMMAAAAVMVEWPGTSSRRDKVEGVEDC